MMIFTEKFIDWLMTRPKDERRAMLQLSIEALRNMAPKEYEELRAAVLELKRQEARPAGPVIPRAELYERMVKE